uniref:E3 ubiquitin-protein ligase MARCHF5 n=1 Tax=Chrysemys picta bellii TaxID=8478 RepID=A0A8C3II14_CHRPI
MAGPRGRPGGVSGPPAMAEPAEERHCWVCFATEREDRAAEWVCPCRCKGSTKWIHQACLQRWLDEKQKGNSTGSVSCPQCGTEYRIIFPKLGPLVYFLHQVDQILSRASPFAMAGIVVGTVYWSAVTYGAVTVMQVVGHKKGLDVMERADPLFLLMGLPTIPVMLVLGRLIRWEDYVLRVWRKYSSKLQALQALVPGRHHLCGHQGGAQSLLQTAAVPAPGQPAHPRLPGAGPRAPGRGQQHRGQPQLGLEPGPCLQLLGPSGRALQSQLGGRALPWVPPQKALLAL